MGAPLPGRDAGCGRALKSLAPSRCTFRPRSFAASAAAAKSASGKTLPPEVLWVFSRHSSLERGKWTSSGLTAARTVSGSMTPSSPGSVRSWTLESIAGAPAS